MSEKIEDELSLPKLKLEMLLKSSNCCCVCQVPFIHAHHIDSNNKNNTFDNLAPLCPNHHTLAHSKNNMTLYLSPERIREFRDRWYIIVETREQTNAKNLGIAKLKIKNFVSSRPLSEYAINSWSKTFSSVDSGYAELKVNEIIDRVFSDSNPDNLKTYLSAMKTMYVRALQNEEQRKEFKDICNTLGFDYDGKNVY